MIRFPIPNFDDFHKEQLYAMCAVSSPFSSPRDNFEYLPVDALYTTGSGLPSFLVKTAVQEDLLLGTKSDSDVIFTQWQLALLLHGYVKEHRQNWLNQLSLSSLPAFQHSVKHDNVSFPITGLNSLLLTLFCIDNKLNINIWRLARPDDSVRVLLSSYIHKLSYEPKTALLLEDSGYPHPFLFLSENDQYQQHLYAALDMAPCGVKSDTFCQRVPFKQLGINYNASAWTVVLVNKLRHFAEFKQACDLALRHPDVFAALVVCSAGFPATFLCEHLNYCSILDMSSYALCELLTVLSPLVDYCTSLMISMNKVNSPISYFINEINPDFSSNSSLMN